GGVLTAIALSSSCEKGNIEKKTEIAPRHYDTIKQPKLTSKAYQRLVESIEKWYVLSGGKNFDSEKLVYDSVQQEPNSGFTFYGLNYKGTPPIDKGWLTDNNWVVPGDTSMVPYALMPTSKRF
ncbi:MAG: hypothetical protein JXA92_09235, partial [candidate division Zixibacteria bacterium]|nr:hypothetical protein [candidate division Zixibacteria bacterium]